ncbi:MAG: response regulator [Hadesarchaea archaeon]|nr:response regulator [Hadesarchaea archaeon]
MPKKKIMIVDDSRAIVRAVELLLEAENFETVSAFSGEECLEKLEREKPDLILLDIMMPGMDGREVCRRIKKTNKKVKVIFLTGVGVLKTRGLSALCQKFHAEISKELGAVDYITKPFDNEDLVRRVKQALG